MSVTKSVVALGIGQLPDSGKIKSLDQPVADFYPEWRQGQNKDITIRMLLNQTSGLQTFPRTDVEIYPAPDAIQLALAAELDIKPGTSAVYSNKAVNVLVGIIEKASGKLMGGFLRAGLFKAMDIHPGRWDADKAGHPYAMAGLPLTAADLAKRGQLVVDRGRWHGQQLLTASHVDTMPAPSSMEGPCGLLWWRIPRRTHFDTDPSSFDMLRSQGVAEDTVAKLQHGLQGAHFASVAAMYAGLREALGPQARAILQEPLISRGIGPYRLFKFSAPIVAYDGNGDGGQYAVIAPKAGLVAVRQIDAGADQGNSGESYKGFVDRVMALAEASGRLDGPSNTDTRSTSNAK